MMPTKGKVFLNFEFHYFFMGGQKMNFLGEDGGMMKLWIFWGGG